MFDSPDFYAEVLDKNETTEIISILVAIVLLRDNQNFYLNVQHKNALNHKENLVHDCLKIKG